MSIVNPQGTVTTVTNNPIQLVESFSSDNYIHENCDETMFRPVVTVMSDPNQQQQYDGATEENVSQPIEMPSQLVVPVIDERMIEQKKKDRELEQKKKLRELEQLEELREKQEAEQITIAKEREEKRKLEVEKSKKKAEEKADETFTAGAQKKGRKSQKFNKKPTEPEKKAAIEKKEKTPPPPIQIIPKLDAKDDKLEETVEKSSKPLQKTEVIESFNAEVEPEPEIVIIEPQADVEITTDSAEVGIVSKGPTFKEMCPEPLPIIEVPDEISVIVSKKKSSAPAVTMEKSNVKEVDPEVVKEKSPAPENVLVEISSAVEVIKENVPTPQNVLTEKPKVLQIQKEASPAPSELKHSKPVSSKEQKPSEIKELKILASKQFEKVESSKPEFTAKKGKKGKKYSNEMKSKQEKVSPKVEEEFPPFGELEPLPPLEPFPTDDYRAMDSETIMMISKHETIGDDEIEIIPAANAMVIQDSPEKTSSDIQIVDEHFELPEKDPTAAVEQKFIRNEDFYDVDDDLPPLEPLESFDGNFEPLCFDDATLEKEVPVDEQKQQMKKKMSELLKDTNMIFAMCSSLKEIKDDEDAKSIDSSQIQRSTSSSLTTNTTTATFASASSNQTGEGMDSDYKSLELDLDEGAPPEPSNDSVFKLPADVKQTDESEDVSSFEATSSETDDSSKRSNTTAPKFKREDDEELRPLLQTSITSLSSPISSSATTATTNDTTEANDTTTLPDINQKSSQPTSNNGNGNKRKNKKKRR